jgi:hypothetical protein
MILFFSVNDFSTPQRFKKMAPQAMGVYNKEPGITPVPSRG